MRSEKQWVHDENPVEIGYREVFSRAQVCAAGLLTLRSIEQLFIGAMQAFKKLQPLRLNMPPKLQAPQ